MTAEHPSTDKPRVLVVDDEAEILAFLRIGLEAYGFDVAEARSGESALRMAARTAPAVMVLDLGLPDGDGHDVLRRLREWSSVPVIVLSVRSSVAEKVEALDAGANDYVVKPFDIRELVARLRAQLRGAPSGRPDAVFEAKGLRVEFAARTVTLDGAPVKLTRKEFDLLALLVRHAGLVVTRPQILQQVWGPAHREATQYLRVYIGQLREKLKDSSSSPRFIATEPGVGYRFLA